MTEHKLTDERISDLWSWSMTAEAEKTATTQQHAFARAIEAELSKQEPVAWQERQQLSIGGAWTNWYACPHRPIDSPRQSLLGGVGGIPIEWRPLYTAPLPSAPDTVQVPPSANCWLNGGPCIGGRCDEPRFCAQNDTIAAAPKSTP